MCGPHDNAYVMHVAVGDTQFDVPAVAWLQLPIRDRLGGPIRRALIERGGQSR